MLANGPGGAYQPDPDADWHLFVGDESAVPAIAAALAVLPEDAVVRVVVLVDSAADEPDLPIPAKGEQVFVHRDAGGGDDRLVAAVQALDWPQGRVDVFAHGEAQEIMHNVRPYLFGERGLARDQVSVSGYWRRGRSEEGFREWKSDLARQEADGAE